MVETVHMALEWYVLQLVSIEMPILPVSYPCHMGLGMRLLTQHALTNAWQHASAYGPAPCSNLPHPCTPAAIPLAYH